MYWNSCSGIARELSDDLFLVWLSDVQLALMNYVRQSPPMWEVQGYLPSLGFFFEGRKRYPMLMLLNYNTSLLNRVKAHKDVERIVLYHSKTVCIKPQGPRILQL